MEPEARTPSTTRRARKKAATRRDIYRAAMRLFRARGFDGVTIEAICEAADVARRTFFLHFPRKSSLLLEFNREVAEQFRARLPEPRGSALSELETLVDLVGERLQAEADVMGAMLREYHTTPVAERVDESAEDDVQQLLVQIVERGQERGEFRADLPASLAVASLLALASVVLSGAPVFPPGTAPRRARAWFFEVLLRGFGAREPG